MDSVDYLIALFDQERSGKKIVCLLLNTEIFVSASKFEVQTDIFRSESHRFLHCLPAGLALFGQSK